MSHILMIVVAGLVALGVFAFGGHLLDGQAGMRRAVRVFIWVWLVASAVNAVFGVVQAGIPVINEIGAFIPIFGIPAALAWYLARRSGAAH
jgi:hypothetical protein